MTRLTATARAALTGLALLLAAPLQAAPVAYRLDAAQSVVGFETDFGPDRITGTMPVAAADIAIDFDRPAASTVRVTLDLAGAQASFPFATQAMLGPKVLDAAAHPTISFESTAVRATGGGGAKAEIEGLLTIRGVTRPVTLAAEVFRREGMPEGDRSRMAIHLDGRVSRAAFGATGWPDMVGDEVRLKIVARIDRAG
jgi:polyisoprenoid-binding protein YceI